MASQVPKGVQERKALQMFLECSWRCSRLLARTWKSPLGNVLGYMRRSKEELVEYQKSLDIKIRVVGDHPGVLLRQGGPVRPGAPLCNQVLGIFETAGTARALVGRAKLLLGGGGCYVLRDEREGSGV